MSSSVVTYGVGALDGCNVGGSVSSSTTITDGSASNVLKYVDNIGLDLSMDIYDISLFVSNV